ncbi:MAG: hypothetical protein OHK0053_10680 [Microscillaceae bacterium]
MTKIQKALDQLNELLYNSRERIYGILKVTNTLTLLIALGTLVYSLGFDLEADETTKVFNWLEALIVVFIIDYFIRMVYAFHRWEYIQEKILESVLVAITFIVFLAYLFGIDLIYFVFLQLGLADYQLFYEFFVSLYILILTVIGLARASQVISTVKVKPATTFIASFIILILFGTFLLMLPAMTTKTGGAPFLVALFTSTSASCVTGLSVVTVASYFTFKGQLVILFLLQLGGIGIVSFATFFATFLSQGVGMKQQAIIQDVLSSENLASAKNMLRQVILLTFLIEAIGAVAVFMSWSPEVVFYSPLTQEEYQAWAQQNAPAQEAELLATAGADIQSQNQTLQTDGGEALEVLSVSQEEAQSPPAPEERGVKINNSLANKIYYSIFHSVSAFCNAGFSLFPDGLAEQYVETNYTLHLVVAFIIIFGSLGFSTIQDVFSPAKMRERMLMPWKQWSLGTQIAMNMTIILSVGGAIIYFFLEQEHTLSNKNLFEGIVAAFFQSVTTRTAGFNTVSLGISDIAQPTYILMLFLMFVGAASGSTGGGIKTSTFMLLVYSALASIRGQKNVEFRNRTIAADTINRAFSIVAFAIAYNVACIFLLVIVQTDIDIRMLFFEQISAFATVGLSNGITGNLNEYSQVIIIVSMYIGRVGTLTLALALSKKVLSTSYQYPTSYVMVG